MDCYVYRFLLFYGFHFQFNKPTANPMASHAQLPAPPATRPSSLKPLEIENRPPLNPKIEIETQ